MAGLVQFRTEEEVKEYLENLSTEYKFSCFHEKDSTGCHLLADYLEAIKSDYDASTPIYKSNCAERKHAHSCFKYATNSFLGRGCTVDEHRALDYFKTSCSHGYRDGCLHAGIMLTAGQKTDSAIKKDYAQGIQLLEKACSGGNPMACFFGSALYATGAEGVPVDMAKAAKMSRDACEGGNIYACMNLSEMYKKGDGVEKNSEKSVFYKEKAKEIRDDQRKKPPLNLQQYT